MSKVADSVFELVRPIAERQGLHLVEVKYAKQYDGMHLTVIIDKKEGVSLNDCQDLHNAIDVPLDELDPTDGKSYILDVSSYGLDRPLKTQWDFDKNMGQKIKIKLFAAVDGHKEFIGTLVFYDIAAGTVTIEQEQGQRTFNVKQTAVIEPVIEF